MTEEKAKCAFCEAEKPLKRLALAERAFSIRQEKSGFSIMTNGKELICLDLKACISQAVKNHIPDIAVKISDAELNRIRREAEEKKANAEGETLTPGIAKTIKGVRMKAVNAPQAQTRRKR